MQVLYAKGRDPTLHRQNPSRFVYTILVDFILQNPSRSKSEQNGRNRAGVVGERRGYLCKYGCFFSSPHMKARVSGRFGILIQPCHVHQVLFVKGGDTTLPLRAYFAARGLIAREVRPPPPAAERTQYGTYKTVKSIYKTVKS